MTNCKSCSEPILEGEQFCTNCGADQTPLESLDAQPLSCSICGAELAEEDQFCTVCGDAVLNENADETPREVGSVLASEQCDSAATSAFEIGSAELPQERSLVAPTEPPEDSLEAPVPDMTASLKHEVLAFIKHQQILIAISVVALAGWIFLDGLRGVSGNLGFALLAAITAAMVVSWPIAVFDIQFAGMSQAFKDQADGPLRDRILIFLGRHKALLTISAVVALGWVFNDEVLSAAGEWGFALMAAMTAALAFSWPVAIIRQRRTLEIVHGVDNFIGGLSKRVARSDSRIGRWAISPVMWLGIGAASLSRFARDPFAAASIRVFCYVLTVAAIVSLVFLAIVLVIAILMLCAALWIIGMVLGGDAPTPRIRLPRSGIAKRGRDQIIHEGNSWLTERRAGRVDKDGNIYEGDGWFNEKKVGRVDEDGRIYEGDSWFNEKQAGRTDADGTIYEGDSWFNEKKAGRVDEDGNIYEGDSWFNENKVGRTEIDD